MATTRKLVRVETPKGQPGFLGAGHIARPVINGQNFSASDPFIMLMDDMLDKKDTEPVGGPHPHAGFETVSLLLEGEIGDEAHKMKGGDFQLMTAGSGIVHTETIDTIAKMRLLQLWLNLPRQNRWATPRVQDLQHAHVPVLKENGMTLKLYSGSLGGIVSPVQNYTPLIVADISLLNAARTVLQLPASYNTFLYVLSGTVKVGAEEKILQADQVGWLDLYKDGGESELILTAGEQGARLALYAGKPTGDTIVSYGPFIADSQQDIQRLYHDYRVGKMQHIAEVADEQRMLW